MDSKPIQTDDPLKIAIVPHKEVKKSENKELVSIFVLVLLTN